MEFENDIKEFQQIFLDNGPPGPHRKSIMLEFCLDAVAKGSEYFVRTMKNELDLTSQLNKETITNLEQSNKELKADINNT